MIDIILEVLRAFIASVLVIYLLSVTRQSDLRQQQGWRYIMLGFVFLLFGMLVDITDNFPSLNRFVVIGDTPMEAFLEKFVGELCGFTFVTIGFLKWLPIVNAVTRTRQQLSQLNISLETTVNERTHDLSRLNAELVEENRRRQQALNALEESEKRWQFALEGSQNGVWDWDIQTNQCYFSERYKTLLKRPDYPDINTIDAWYQLIHPDDRLLCRQEMAKHLAGETPFFENEHRLHGDNGDDLWVLARGKVIEFSENKQPRRVIGTHTDITFIKQAEAGLRLTAKMDAMGQLTGGIAHDFNNILGIIIGNLSFLEPQCQSDEKSKKRCQAIKHSTQRAIELTGKLLSFTKNKPSTTITTNINQQILGMEDLIKHSLSPQISITHQLADDLWNTNIDSGDFEDCLLNLMLNAKDAMEDVGSISVQTKNMVVDKNTFTGTIALAAGDYVQLTVTDTGVGIPFDQQERIFEPFYTTKGQGKGTGLGLTMVFNFIKRSQGGIQLKSKPGASTTFELYLPRDYALIKDDAASESDTEQVMAGKETLLVVDDELALLDLTVESLSKAGYHVLFTTEVSQAIDYLKNQPCIDLLITDVIMPGLNGYQLADQAVLWQPRIKILHISGYFNNKNIKTEHQTYYDNILTKPFTQKALLQRIRTLFLRA